MSDTTTPLDATAPTSVDVLIVGGSIAGLAAAGTLKRVRDADPSLSFVLLEQGSTLGGDARTLPPTAANPHHAYLDLGPSYLSPIQNFALEAVFRLGLKYVDTPLDPKLNWLFESSDGTILTLPGQPDTFPGGLLATKLIGTLDMLALWIRTDLRHPERLPGAQSLDVSVKDWLTAWLAQEDAETPQQHAYILEAFACAVRSVFAAELHEVSFLYMLWHGATAGAFSMLVAPAGGFAWRLAYGAADLVRVLEAEVKAGDILRGAKVTALKQATDGTVLVTTSAGQYVAKRVIVATSARSWVDHTLDTKDVDVLLQLGRHKAFAQKAKRGRAVKAWVFYKRPFWRDMGLQATILAAREHDPDGPISWTLDHSWEVADWDPQRPVPRYRHAIACWISDAYLSAREAEATSEGAEATATLGARRKRAVIAQLKRFFGPLAESELLQPSVDGAEPYLDTDMLGLSREQFTTYLPPGAISSGVFRPSDLGAAGPVVYATSALSPEWAGSIEGELHMGVHAATLAVGAIGPSASLTASLVTVPSVTTTRRLPR